MGIFEDKLRKSLGLETKKESLDNKIQHYELAKENEIKYRMAQKQQIISKILERIRQIELIIEDNQFFIDAYELIKKKAIEKIKQRDSVIENNWINKNGQEIFRANYKEMNDYLNSLLKKRIDINDITFFNKELADFLNEAWILYANAIILGKGMLKVDGKEIDDCYEIYVTYVYSLNSIKAGKLKNSSGKAVSLSETEIELILKAKDFSEKTNNNLLVLLSQLKYNLNILKNNQANNEYTLKAINETRKLMESSEEYAKAKASHDYLEEFGRKH